MKIEVEGIRINIGKVNEEIKDSYIRGKVLSILV